MIVGGTIMSRKCSHCNTIINDDDKFFCPNCGELIDKNLSLITDIDKTVNRYSTKDTTQSKKTTVTQPETTKPRKHTYDDNTEIKKMKTQKSGNNSAVFIIIAVIIIIAIILAIFVL